MSCGANMAQSCRDCMEENNGLCGVVDGVWEGAWELVEIYAKQAAGNGSTSRPKIPENNYCANVNIAL